MLDSAYVRDRFPLRVVAENVRLELRSVANVYRVDDLRRRSLVREHAHPGDRVDEARFPAVQRAEYCDAPAFGPQAVFVGRGIEGAFRLHGRRGNDREGDFHLRVRGKGMDGRVDLGDETVDRGAYLERARANRLRIDARVDDSAVERPERGVVHVLAQQVDLRCGVVAGAERGGDPLDECGDVAFERGKNVPCKSAKSSRFIYVPYALDAKREAIA